jgi:ABC-2 type transport system ATP-binding protein
MSSHLLGEIESVCDSLVVIDAGRLVRSGPISTFTGLVGVLAVEVDRDPDVLIGRLTEIGLDASMSGRAVAVRLPDGIDAEDYSVHRTVVGAVADLGLPLVKVARQRHTLTDIFRSAAHTETDRFDKGSG